MALTYVQLTYVWCLSLLLLQLWDWKSLKTSCTMVLPELPATTIYPSLGWGHPSVRLEDLEENPGYHHKRHDWAKDNGVINFSLFACMASWKWQRFHCDGICVVHLPMTGLGTSSAREWPKAGCSFCPLSGGCAQQGGCRSAVEDQLDKT